MNKKVLKDFCILILLDLYIVLYQYFYTFIRNQVGKTYELKYEIIYLICTMIIYGILLAYISTREFSILSLALFTIILVVQIVLRLYRREMSLLLIYLGFIIYEIFKNKKCIR